MFLGDPRKQLLADPQTLNSYAYANENPVIHSDPTGLLVSQYQPYLPLQNLARPSRRVATSKLRV
jgi:hypothetical protein